MIKEFIKEYITTKLDNILKEYGVDWKLDEFCSEGYYESLKTELTTFITQIIKEIS